LLHLLRQLLHQLLALRRAQEVLDRRALPLVLDTLIQGRLLGRPLPFR
jgi:hypothetical protein